MKRLTCKAAERLLNVIAGLVCINFFIQLGLFIASTLKTERIAYSGSVLLTCLYFALATWKPIRSAQYAQMTLLIPAVVANLYFFFLLWSLEGPLRWLGLISELVFLALGLAIRLLLAQRTQETTPTQKIV